MARKKDAVDIHRSPKAPWESYDPLSVEVYGEPFEFQLSPVQEGPGEADKVEDNNESVDSSHPQGSDETKVSSDPRGVIRSEGIGSDIPEVEVDVFGAVEAPPKVQVEGVEEVPIATEDGAVLEAEPVVKEVGQRVAKRRMAPQSSEKVMEPTKITRRRVVRRRKIVK